MAQFDDLKALGFKTVIKQDDYFQKLKKILDEIVILQQQGKINWERTDEGLTGKAQYRAKIELHEVNGKGFVMVDIFLSEGRLVNDKEIDLGCHLCIGDYCMNSAAYPEIGNLFTLVSGKKVID